MTKISKHRLLGGFVVFLFCIFFIPPILKPDNHQNIVQEETKNLFEPKTKQIAKKQPVLVTSKASKKNEVKITPTLESPKKLVLESTISLESIGGVINKDNKENFLAIGDFAENSAAKIASKLLTSEGVKSKITTINKLDGKYFRILLPYKTEEDKNLIEKVAKKKGYKFFDIDNKTDKE